MSKWILIWGGLAAIGGIIWLVMTISQKLGARKHEARARELLANGNWQGAAGSYKAAIIAQLGSAGALAGLVRSLQQLYQANGIDADLSKILDAPNLLKEIWATNVAPAEQGRLTGKLYAQMTEVLNAYPGEIPT